MFQEILSNLAKNLAEADIPYMVIGGQAVLVYGEPRMTRDIDVTLGIDTEQFERVHEAALAIGLQALPSATKDFVDQHAVFPCLHAGSGIRVDFIFSFTPYERSAITRGRDVEIGGTSVRFAAPEDLIIHKLFAGRPRDVEDVRGVLVRKPSLDRRYLEKWLKEFSASTGRDLLEELRSIEAGIR